MKKIILFSLLLTFLTTLAFTAVKVPDAYWQFNEYVSIKKLNSYKLPVLVFFGSKKADEYTEYYEMIRESNRKYKGKVFIKYVNIDKEKKYKKEFDIDKYPVFYVFKDGEPYAPKENKELYKNNNDLIYHDGTLNIKQFHSLLKELGVSVVLSDDDKKAYKKVELLERLKNDPNDYSLNFTNLNDYLGKGLPIIIDFGASWCGPCRSFHPVLEEAANNFAGLAFIKYVDVDYNHELPSMFNVNAIPCQIFIDSKGKQYIPQNNYYGLEINNGYTSHTGGMSISDIGSILRDMGMESL